jgi:hypothetical protein
MVSTGAVGFSALIFLTISYIVSQFEGGCISTEPFSSLTFRAGFRRSLVARDVFSGSSSFIVVSSFLVRLATEPFNAPEAMLVDGAMRRRFLTGGSSKSSMSAVLADERDEVSSLFESEATFEDTKLGAVVEYLNFLNAPEELRVWRFVDDMACMALAVSCETRDVLIAKR